MSQSIVDQMKEDSDCRMTSDELATRVFTVSMVGVVGAILLMIVLEYR